MLVIGNGFDLDLGLPTRYADFAASEFWPFKEPILRRAPNGQRIDSLHDVMHQASIQSTWFDIEALLESHANFNGKWSDSKFNFAIGEAEKYRIEQDEADYNLLVEKLTDYLNSIDLSRARKDSIAGQVFSRAIHAGLLYGRIYSFNYTNLNYLAQELDEPSYFHYMHMHGSLKKGIILGIESGRDFYPAYRYMCKEYNEHYKSRDLKAALERANHVIIFGHSLSEIDEHYFKRFFKVQSSETLELDRQKKITIFVKDINSRRDLLDRLQILTDRKLSTLFANNQLSIIHTVNPDEKALDEFFADMDDLRVM